MDPLFLVTLWVVVVVEISRAQAGVQKSGPFKVLLQSYDTCEDEGTAAVVWGTKVYRTPDGKHVYNNTIYYGHPVDKDFKMKTELQSFSNGGYRPRYMVHTFKGCEEIWPYWQEYYKKFESDGGPIEKCPVPAGTYRLAFDLKKEVITNIPSLIYNKYRVITTFYYKGKKVGCFVTYAEVVPRE